MKFLDTFAGTGGFRFGMEAAGHECVGYIECDPYCVKCKKVTKIKVLEEKNYTMCTVCGTKKRQHARFSYEAIFDTEGEWTAYDITSVTDDDIRRLRDRGPIDVICGGFPCQAFSVAGKREGFDDTRGTLFFEIARFANIIRPLYLFLENVKGLLNHDGGVTFEVILRTLDELGYDAEWQVLNSKDFGVPQNRERVFIIGHLRGRSTRKVFPIRGTSCQANSIEIITHRKGFRRNTQVFNPTGITETLDTGQGGGRGHYTISKVGNENAIRKLTPRECWRLQGFPDWAFDRAAVVNSDSQLYKQAGNSVTVNVIEAIAKELYCTI